MKFKMTKNILITGGDGFIAKSLNNYLYKKYNISLCNRKELNLLDSSNVFNYIKKNNFDVIIHTGNYDAGPTFSIKDPNKVLENNLKMFFNIERCKDYFDKMIYFGSGAEFGGSLLYRKNWNSKMSEEYLDKNIPLDWPYGFSKYIMSKYALLSNNIYNLRLFAICGELDDWRYRFLSNACCKAVLNLPITIKKNVSYDYLYIKDLSKIVEWTIINKPKKHIYNVCSGKIYSCKNLAKKIIKITNKNLNINILDTITDIYKYGGNNSLIVNEMKNFKFTSIDNIISNMLEFYQMNKQNIDISQFEY